MLGSKCTAEIISKEYDENGIQAAIHKLKELKAETGERYYFSHFELLMLCREMIEAGKISDSDMFFHTLLNNLDESYRTQRGYGMICLMHGPIQKGLTLLRNVMSEYPTELMVMLYTEGIRLLRISRCEDALEILQFNVNEYPDHYLSNYGLARVYEQLGDIEQSIKSCEKALRLRPDYNPAKKLLKQLKEKN